MLKAQTPEPYRLTVSELTVPGTLSSNHPPPSPGKGSYGVAHLFYLFQLFAAFPVAVKNTL